MPTGSCAGCCDSMSTKVGTFLRENVNGFVVLGGAAWLYLGLSGWSRHAADVVAGLVVMTIGVYPYLRRKRKP